MNGIRSAGRTLSFACSTLQAAVAPWLDVLIRFGIAQAFLMVQVHQMMFGPGRDAARLGSLSDPLHAQWWFDGLHTIMTGSVGFAVQAACPLLLAIGLAARPAAAAMLVQLLVLPVAGLGLQSGGGTAVLWAALLLRIVLQGPGLLSIDAFLRGGTESIALPGAAALGRGLGLLERMSGRFYQAALRIWLAAVCAGVGLLITTGGSSLTPSLPTPAVALGVRLLLALGAGVRVVAAGLLLVMVAGDGTVVDAEVPWALLLGVLIVHGAGWLSVDRALGIWCGGRATVRSQTGLPHVVVVGGGFGGAAAVRGLRRSACRVTLIDQRNYHLFQPLLYQVATAGLSPGDIATPIRSIFRGQDNVRVLLGEVTGVDTAARAVMLNDTHVSYDHLVIATGAQHGYFGRDEWAPFAPGLKTVEDGTAVRRRLLLAFEEAEGAATEADRRAWLTFVIVGGGPTGVELAGAIAELARHGLDREFREFDPASARVILIQSGPRLLPAFPKPLSEHAASALRHLEVEVMLDSRVEGVSAQGVTVSGRPVQARTVLWAAGVMASPAARWLSLEPDRAGRVQVGPDLGIAGLPGVFAIGDTAASLAWAGQAVPGLAPAAKQGGAYVAKVIRAQLAGRTAPPAFRYRHLGSLATIGRRSAVADFGFVRVRGAPAWWLWGAAHIAFLVGGRNRATVLVQWLWAYLTFRRGTRLITRS